MSDEFSLLDQVQDELHDLRVEFNQTESALQAELTALEKVTDQLSRDLDKRDELIDALKERHEQEIQKVREALETERQEATSLREYVERGYLKALSLGKTIHDGNFAWLRTPEGINFLRWVDKEFDVISARIGRIGR